jgi:hypothetical protein
MCLLKKIFSSFAQIFVGFVVKKPCSPIEEQSRRERERAMETEKLTHILILTLYFPVRAYIRARFLRLPKPI